MYTGKASISRLPVKQQKLDVPGSDRRSRLTMRSRGSSTSRTSALTIAETPGLRRSRSSQSLRPTPQPGLSARSSSGSRLMSTERAKHKAKDSRPLQDKKWQHHQQAKVQAYFQRLPGGHRKLHKGTSIRPMTLAMFVDLCNTVLQNIDARFPELTLANYTEQLPNHMALLTYPGVVNKSMLKTANTMHSWPHVLGLLSWLVELHQLEDVPIEQALFHVPEDAPLPYRIEKLKWRIAMDAFVAWNTQQPELDVAGTFERSLKAMYGIQEGQDEALRAENTEKKQYLADLQAQVQLKKKSVEESQHRLNVLKQDMQKDQDNYRQQVEYSKRIKETVAARKQNIEKLKQAIEQEQRKHAEMDERIAQQPMNRRQRDEKLALIENLRAKLALRKETRAIQQQISDKKDLQLSQHKRQLEQKINAHNNALIEPALRFPELRELTLPEDGFLRSDAQQLIEEKSRKKHALAKRLVQENEHLAQEISELRERFSNLQREMNEAELARDKKMQALEELQARVADQREAAQERERAAQSQIQTLRQKIEQLSAQGDQPDYHELIPKLNELRKKCNWWQSAIEAEQEKGIATFTKLEADIDKYIAKLRENRDKIDKAVPKPE